ncbi:MAG: YihY/virulence factor BrkB family protein [Williamsia sp.]|nr:YihY/virulence factor BrkB family protein [Williamsia sp.]
MTYFAAIAVVPWVLLAVWSTTWFDGVDDAERRLLQLRILIPPEMGARPVFDTVVHTGTHLGLLGVVVMLFPASFYGEGLRRACVPMHECSDRLTSWRGRVSMMALIVLVPPLTWIYVRVGTELIGLSPEGGADGWGSFALRVWAGFTSTWLLMSVALTWVFRAVTPGRPRWWVAVVGATVTASFVSGFAQGFLLFLSIGIDVGIPYGGLRVVGGVVAVGLWLYVMHILIITGWALTQAIDLHHGRTQQPAPHPDAVDDGSPPAAAPSR